MDACPWETFRGFTLHVVPSLRIELRAEDYETFSSLSTTFTGQGIPFAMVLFAPSWFFLSPENGAMCLLYDLRVPCFGSNRNSPDLYLIQEKVQGSGRRTIEIAEAPAEGS